MKPDAVIMEKRSTHFHHSQNVITSDGQKHLSMLVLTFNKSPEEQGPWS